MIKKKKIISVASHAAASASSFLLLTLAAASFGSHLRRTEPLLVFLVLRVLSPCSCHNTCCEKVCVLFRFKRSNNISRSSRGTSIKWSSFVPTRSNQASVSENTSVGVTWGCRVGVFEHIAQYFQYAALNC